jgi:hypothetical protein
MNPVVGWGLALVGLVAAWLQYGWRGLLLAMSLIVFWLLLQFSRALRVMRMAAARPMGSVDSAVMLNAKLKPGLTMMQVVALTRSLGRQVGQSPERWLWADTGEVSVTLEFERGKLARWDLQRPAE